MLRVRSSLAVGALLSVLAFAGGGVGCSRSFEAERRETPVHVWLVAPALAAGNGAMDADISLGGRQVVRDVVRFPPGVATVELPSAYVRVGTHRVVVRLAGGRIRAAADVEIEREAWVRILVAGDSVQISLSEEQPDSAGG